MIAGCHCQIRNIRRTGGRSRYVIMWSHQSFNQLYSSKKNFDSVNLKNEKKHTSHTNRHAHTRTKTVKTHTISIWILELWKRKFPQLRPALKSVRHCWFVISNRWCCNWPRTETANSAWMTQTKETAEVYGVAVNVAINFHVVSLLL